jgi:hypothetical protein
MIVVLLASVITGWLGMGLVSNHASTALRLIVFIIVLNLAVLIPVQLVGAFNLVAGVPVRPAIILAAQLPLLLVAAVIGRRSRQTRGADESPLERRLRVPPVIRVACGLLIASYVIFAASSYTLYPSGWDGLAYHLPLALQWLQQESLRLPASLSWQYSMPGNGEILMKVGLGTGIEQSATVFNLGALTLVALGVFLLALRLSANRAVALACSLIALSMPILQFQVFSAYVDLYAAGFLLAGLVMFLDRDAPIWTDGRGTFTPDVLAGLAFGVAAGTKLIAVFYAGFAGLLMAAALLIREGWPRASRFSVLLVLGAFVSTGFWLLRGWSATGNPFFPLEIRALDLVLFEGIPPGEITPEDYWNHFVRSPAWWLIYPWTEWHDSGFSYGTGQGFGAAFATVVPLGLAYLLVDWFRNLRKAGLAQVLLAACIVCLGVWWFAMHQVPRFAMPLLVLSCALAAPLLARLFMTDLRLPGWLVLLAIGATVTISTATPALSIARRVRDGNPTRAEFYGLPAFLDSLPPGTRLLNLGNSRYNYGLAGPCVCNRITGDFEVSDPVEPHDLARVNPEYVVVDVYQDGETLHVLQTAGFRSLPLEPGAGPAAAQIWRAAPGAGEERGRVGGELLVRTRARPRPRGRRRGRSSRRVPERWMAMLELSYGRARSRSRSRS